MQSKATTVAEYLAELSPERRKAIAAVRTAIRKALPAGYKEQMQYGMIGYVVPHAIYPAGYHCDPTQPLPFVCLASQKNHMAVYLWGLYGDPGHEEWFREEWKKTGKRLDMGKCCVRFRKIDDLPIELIGTSVKRVPVQRFVKVYEAAIGKSRVAKARAAKSKGTRQR